MRKHLRLRRVVLSLLRIIDTDIPITRISIKVTTLKSEIGKKVNLLLIFATIFILKNKVAGPRFELQTK